MISNRFSSWSYLFVQTASPLILFCIDLEMFVRFRIECLCFRTDRWRAACFRTASLLMNMLSYRLTTWKHVFVQIVCWLVLCRIDEKIHDRFRSEGIVFIRFRVEFSCFWTEMWCVACFRAAGLFTYTLSNRFTIWNHAFLQTASSLILFRKYF